VSETRRLAAALAVDVIGYSRLIGEDEAGRARSVREHREAAHPIAFNAMTNFPQLRLRRAIRTVRFTCAP
jgi:hypothetical protein